MRTDAPADRATPLSPDPTTELHQGLGPPTPATLEETVAAETAALLLEAAEARHLASSINTGPASAELLRYASALENDAAKWEQRLRWWNHLRTRERRA